MLECECTQSSVDGRSQLGAMDLFCVENSFINVGKELFPLFVRERMCNHQGQNRR